MEVRIESQNCVCTQYGIDSVPIPNPRWFDYTSCQMCTFFNICNSIKNKEG